MAFVIDEVQLFFKWRVKYLYKGIVIIENKYIAKYPKIIKLAFNFHFILYR